MGRPRKPQAPSSTVADQIEALQAKIATLETERLGLLADGLPTVQAQIDHLKAQVQIHSHLAAIARYSADTQGMKAHSVMQVDLTAEIHKLQRDIIIDRLDVLYSMAVRQTAAASKLAAFIDR